MSLSGSRRNAPAGKETEAAAASWERPRGGTSSGPGHPHRPVMLLSEDQGGSDTFPPEQPLISTSSVFTPLALKPRNFPKQQARAGRSQKEVPLSQWLQPAHQASRV